MPVREAAKTSFWEIFTKDARTKLHEDTMRVLEEVGVEVMHAGARDLLAKAGARVEGTRAWIGRKLVEKAVQTAPKDIMVYSRDAQPAMRLAPGYSYFGTGSDVIWMEDPRTGKRVKTDRDTVALTTRLTDALENFDFAMSMGVAHGVPAEQLDQTHFALMAENTTKVVLFTSQTRQSMQDLMRIASIIRGGNDALKSKPFCVLYAMPTSPLLHTEEAIDVTLLAAEHGVPVIYVPGPMSGGTAPVTIAGSTILGNAETLSGLVIHQLHRPGAPFVHGPIPSPLDMRTMVNVYNGPFSMMAFAAGSEMGRHYGLPTFQIGGTSDSKQFDQQAASEAAMSLLVAAQSGGTIIHDVGYLESGLQASPCLMTWCDEIIDQIRFMQRGVSVSDHDNLVDAIREVGPRGSFLEHPSTFERFRDGLWQGKLTDARPYDAWANAGAKDTMARVRERTLELLENHHPKPLDEGVRKDIWKIASPK